MIYLLNNILVFKTLLKGLFLLCDPFKKKEKPTTSNTTCKCLATTTRTNNRNL